MTREAKRAKYENGKALGRRAGAGLACAALVLGAGASGGCQCVVRSGDPADPSAGPAPTSSATPGATTPAPPGGTTPVPPGEGTPPKPPGGGTPPKPPAGDTPPGPDSLMPYCPTGSPTCDPENNGLGVYIARGGKFCLPTLTPQSRLCPETFVNGPQGVMLKLFLTAGPGNAVHTVPVSGVFLEAGPGPNRTRKLKSISADKARLVVKYESIVHTSTGVLSSIETATDAQLTEMSFEFKVPTLTAAFEYSLKFERAGAVNADGPAPQALLERYRVSYRTKTWGSGSAAWGPWQPICVGEGGQLKSSFVGGREVNDKSAKVTANANAVTMSCETGAVDTCTKWGYAPWAGGGGPAREQLFGACLQAKRAAYYVGQGELGGFTRPGTPLLLKDVFGVHNDAIDAASLEAAWSPEGAQCFTWKRRRRPELLRQGHPPNVTMRDCVPGATPSLLRTSLGRQGDKTD